MIFKKRSPINPLLTCVTILLILISAATPSQCRTYTEEEKTLYYWSLIDTQTAAQNEISRSLLAIVPGPDPVNHRQLAGDDIRWQGEPGNSPLLVIAFMSRTSYQNYYQQHLENNPGEDYILQKSLWVTVVPELKNRFMRRIKSMNACPPAPERVHQILGLNPAYDYEVLLEFWISPRDLFRPTPDPEIQDHEGELAYPDTNGNWIFPRDMNPFLKLDDSVVYMDSAWSQPMSFRDWFVNRAETIYAVGDDSDLSTWGWPWTRLGYTYDWGNPLNPTGLSEFLIRLDPDQGNSVTIKLEQAVDIDSPEWNSYFRCDP